MHSPAVSRRYEQNHVSPTSNEAPSIYTAECLDGRRAVSSVRRGQRLAVDGPTSTDVAGALVRHLWRDGKGRQPEELVDQVLRYLMPALYSDFRDEYWKVMAEVLAQEPRQGSNHK
ncbi:hypothetical protein V2A60_006083 [Cordyceps javanica]